MKEARRLGKYKNKDTDEGRQCRPLLISTDNPFLGRHVLLEALI